MELLMYYNFEFKCKGLSERQPEGLNTLLPGGKFY